MVKKSCCIHNHFSKAGPNRKTHKYKLQKEIMYVHIFSIFTTMTNFNGEDNDTNYKIRWY